MPASDLRVLLPLVVIVTYTLQKENFHSNSNFVISLMVNSQNLNFVYYNIFRNLSMTAHIIEIRKPKLANIKFHENDQSEAGR